jgi:uncharacterized MAPEG superfamily protein
MHAISIAIYAMVAASVLPFLTAGLSKLLGRFTLKDNDNPRVFAQALTGVAARTNAAQLNAYETLPVFLAAVLTAEYMVVQQGVINHLAWAYVVLRVLYTVAYMINMSVLRSTLWTLSFACSMLLFYFSVRIN